MENSTNKAKETDITGVIVGILIVMIGILAVTVSNTFLQVKTSSDTKAATNEAKPQLECNKGLGANPILLVGAVSSDSYISSGDYCSLSDMGMDSKVGCKIAGIAGGTCIRKGNLNAVGDTRCQRMNTDKKSTCKSSCANNAKNTQLTGSCALKGGDGVITEGKCCGTVQPSPTPVAKGTGPTVGIVANNTRSCGTYKIDCENIRSEIPVGTQIECIGNASKAWCAYSVGTNPIICSGTKAKYPILDGNGKKSARSLYCLKEVNEISIKPSNSSDLYCSFAQTKVNPLTGSSASTEAERLAECKSTIVTSTAHIND